MMSWPVCASIWDRQEDRTVRVSTLSCHAVHANLSLTHEDHLKKKEKDRFSSFMDVDVSLSKE